MNAQQTAEAYWQAMQSNDFYLAANCLSADVEIHWPQSGERITGRDNFAELNSAYPAEGRWTFVINCIVADGQQVVTDVTVSDGKRTDTAITFHTVEQGLIRRQVEYWPENYPAPKWRKPWVEYVG
ncbi:nuclear transport factor 2 family protein [Vibrio sp. V39_P1S14PM300]|uniref:nuclear transport factor 2 family protein n=1 Tax=Vibrio sp. V39_P1S14PM300 TaxID=1938690 RepID=UPI0013735BA2|nr:nuclear transport factor 2 family protein [Vibrio sp. V39_P1S14PM300]NAX19801.1 nuclear transport factor 2 family protein [Vibrio sp. V39_P1S14PM300]